MKQSALVRTRAPETLLLVGLFLGVIGISEGFSKCLEFADTLGEVPLTETTGEEPPLEVAVGEAPPTKQEPDFAETPPAC